MNLKLLIIFQKNNKIINLKKLNKLKENIYKSLKRLDLELLQNEKNNVYE